MDSFRVRIKASASRELEKRPFPFRRAVSHAISEFKRDPRPARSEPLPRAGAYRLRVSGYRVVYLVDENEAIARVIRIAR